jgi:hypothetical protein
MRRRRSNPVQCLFWIVHSRMKKKRLALLSNVVLSMWKVSLSLSLSLSRLSHDLLDRNVVASSMKTYNATRAKLWALEIGSREEL